MYALIGMLFNTAKNTYHPIFYYESPFPGEGTDSVVRFKSKGHHTTGFEKLGDAIDSLPDLQQRITGQGYIPIVDIEAMIEWNGDGVPADTELRTPQFISEKIK